LEKILIIDDDFSVLNLISIILEKNGYQCFIAQDGAKGLELAKSLSFSLIICDIMMPKLDGFEVLKKLNQDSGTSSVPFIFLTAKSGIEDIKTAMQLGADSYIMKPFTNKEFLSIIRMKLDKVKLYKRKQTPENSVPETRVASRNKLKDNSSILLDIAGIPTLVKLHNIEYMAADGDYSSVFIVDKGKVLVKKSLKNWERILPEESFLRAHRSVILNINLIENMRKWSKRSYVIKMHYSKEPFITSQRCTSKIKSIFKT
jgi:DNA-binding response OmpR family regulator